MDYRDQHGDRHIKTFAKKRDADAHHAIVGVAVRAGTHTADSKSVTVAKAAELWLDSCEAAGLERTTLAAYRQHVELHIVPILGALQALAADRPAGARLRGPAAAGRALAGDGAQGAAARSARILADAQERGLVGAERRALAARQPARQGPRASSAGNGKLKIGVDIPSPDEIRAIIAALPPSRSRTLAAAAADRDLHRPARVRAARAAMGRRRFEAQRTSRAPARRPLRQDRAAEVGGGRAHRAAAADGGRPCCASTASPARERARLTSPSPTARAASSTATPSSSADCIRRRSRPVWSSRARTASRSQVSRACTPAPLLCLVVHQPARRRRAGTAAQGGAGAARPCLDPDDGGHLRPSVPARRRRRRAGGRRKGIPRRLKEGERDARRKNVT